LNTLVVWDIDDVLNPLMHEWLKHQKSTKRIDPSFSYESLIDPDFSQTLKWGRNSFLESLDEFRLQFQSKLLPNRMIQNWFENQSKIQIKHVALTATPRVVSEISRNWLQVNFGTHITDFFLAPSARDNDDLPRMTKLDFYQQFTTEFKQVIAIDDRQDNLANAKTAGASTLCWPQPWNDSLLDSEETLKALSRMIFERS
jgi:hypothetical protein